MIISLTQKQNQRRRLIHRKKEKGPFKNFLRYPSQHHLLQNPYLSEQDREDLSRKTLTNASLKKSGIKKNISKN